MVKGDIVKSLNCLVCAIAIVVSCFNYFLYTENQAIQNNVLLQDKYEMMIKDLK